MRRWAILRTPPQGWSSLLVLLGMLGLVGYVITDMHPLLPSDERQPWTLAIVMVASGLVGFVLARSSIGLVRSHVIGAATAAGLLLVVVAAGVEGGASGTLLAWLLEPDLLAGRLARLLEAIRVDVMEEPRTFAAGTLILGAICWTTGQFGASSIYRFDRGVPAVVAAGTLLLLIVALPSPEEHLDVVIVLAVFSALAMLLLVRLQLNQQRRGWARRHISDTGEVSRLFLRTGIVFVALSVAGASVLTAATERATIEGPWEDLEDQLPEIGSELQWLLGHLGIRPAIEEPTFGDSAPVGARWEPAHGIAFVSDGVDLLGNYWWGAAWDAFDGRDWHRSDEDVVDVPVLGRLPFVPRDLGDPRTRIETTIEVRDSSFAQASVFAASEPIRVDLPTDAVTIGDAGSLAQVDHDDELAPGSQYVVTASALDYGPSTELTVDALRAAGSDYPADVRQRYATVRAGTTGPLTKALAERIRARAERAGLDDPWELARRVEAHLRGPEFTYEIDMTDALATTCAGLTTPECVLTVKQGFCTYYATTMAMVLREMGIATRLVWGYLPGALEDGLIVVEGEALHAWPEVFFPGIGWVRFDPTPLVVEHGRLPFEPPEAPEATDDPGGGGGPSGGGDDGDVGEDPPEPEPSVLPTAGPVPPNGGDGGVGGLPIVLIGLLAAAGALAVGASLSIARLRRLPRADVGLAYRGIVGLATRLGYGPHPSQTELEYAGSLSETIPSVRDDLYVVTRAQVTSAYSPRAVGGDASALRQAYARIRTALVRLFLRRWRPRA